MPSASAVSRSPRAGSSCEHLAQVTVADLGVMTLERLPGLALTQRRNVRHVVSFDAQSYVSTVYPSTPTGYRAARPDESSANHARNEPNVCAGRWSGNER